MADDKFTINVKLKGVLDKEATEKQLKKEIKTLEKEFKTFLPQQTPKQIIQEQIKQKQTQLKTVTAQKQAEYKNYLKAQKEEKMLKERAVKQEEKRNVKHAKFREKVEKFRLNETKKLMKEGHSFESARKIAFKRSLMSSKDLRKLEYEKIKKEGVYSLKDQLSKIAKGGFGATALGTFVGTAGAKAASSILGFILQSVYKRAEDDRLAKHVGVSFSKTERKRIEDQILSKTPTAFATERERSDYLKSVRGFESTVLGTRGLEGQATRKFVDKGYQLVADLVAKYATDLPTASQAVEQALEGKFEAIYQIMRVSTGNAKKYQQENLDKFTTLQEGNVLLRYQKIEEILEDVKHLNKDGATQFDKTSADFRSLMDNIEKTVANSANDVLQGISSIIQFMKNPVENTTKIFAGVFEGAYTKISGLINLATEKIKGAFSVIVSPFKAIAKWLGWVDKDEESKTGDTPPTGK